MHENGNTIIEPDAEEGNDINRNGTATGGVGRTARRTLRDEGGASTPAAAVHGKHVSEREMSMLLACGLGQFSPVYVSFHQGQKIVAVVSGCGPWISICELTSAPAWELVSSWRDVGVSWKCRQRKLVTRAVCEVSECCPQTNSKSTSFLVCPLYKNMLITLLNSNFLNKENRIVIPIDWPTSPPATIDHRR